MQFHVRLGDGGLERIQVHDHEINRCDGVLLDRRFVRFVATNEEQPAMNFRVQRLHAAVEHFGKAGVFADVLHGEAGFAQSFGSAAGGDDFDSRLRENLSEGN